MLFLKRHIPGVTIAFCFFILAEAKLTLNDSKSKPPRLLFPLENVFLNLFVSKALCIWTDHNVTGQALDVLEHIHNFFNHTIIHLQYEGVNVSAKTCHNNVVFDPDFRNKSHFFKERISDPTVRHVFLIVDIDSTFIKRNNTDPKMFKVFGSAKTLVLQEFQMLKLSSPYFPPRRLQLLTSLTMLEDAVVDNLRGRNVKVATFNCSLYTILPEPLKTGPHDGIEMRMLQELAHRVNFTWTTVPLAGDGRWGDIVPNGSWVGGIMGALENGEAEVGFCNVWNTFRGDHCATFGYPWYMMKYSYMVPRPHLVHGFWMVAVQLFERSVWIILLVTFVLVSLLFWKFKKSRHHIFSDAVESVLTVFGMMIATSSHTPASMKFARHVLFCWCVLTFLVSSLFCNMIISRIMVPYHSSLVDSVQDIVLGNFSWGEPAYHNASKRTVYFNLENPWHRALESRYLQLTKNTTTAALHSGRFVFPVQRLGHEYVFIYIKGLDTSDLSKFRVMRETLNEIWVSLAFSKHYPLIELCYTKLIRFQEVGLVNHWKKDVILRHGGTQEKLLLIDPHIEGVDTIKAITFDNILSAFRILWTGLALASLVFSFEFFFTSKHSIERPHDSQSGPEQEWGHQPYYN